MKILCYGDSNTYGYIPGSGGRYDENTRWTGILQHLLGDDHTVINEGLNSRTTVLDDPLAEGKNGLTALFPCIKQHFPVDMMLVMLGSNDMKDRFGYTAADSAQGNAVLIDTVKAYCRGQWMAVPKLLLIAPPKIETQAIGSAFDAHSVAESGKFGVYYASVATKTSCAFIDAAKIVKPSVIDGLHLDPDAHEALAKAIYKAIQNM